MKQTLVQNMFEKEILPQLEEQGKVRNTEKCAEIFKHIAHRSRGQNPKGLRESMLPEHLRPGHRYLKRLAEQSDAVKTRGVPGEGTFLADSLNDQLFFFNTKQKEQEYMHNLCKFLEENNDALDHLAKRQGINKQDVLDTVYTMIDIRDTGTLNEYVEILIEIFDVTQHGFGYLQVKKAAEYYLLTDYYKRKMEA